MEDCTVVMVDSVNKQGLLLEVVQVMTDLNLVISKSYISSDAKWFMDGRVFCCNILYLQHFVGSYDQALLKNNWFVNSSCAVFHVQDEQGKKLRDQNVINCIQQVINVIDLSSSKRD